MNSNLLLLANSASRDAVRHNLCALAVFDSANPRMAVTDGRHLVCVGGVPTGEQKATLYTRDSVLAAAKVMGRNRDVTLENGRVTNCTATAEVTELSAGWEFPSVSMVIPKHVDGPSVVLGVDLMIQALKTLKDSVGAESVRLTLSKDTPERSPVRLDVYRVKPKGQSGRIVEGGDVSDQAVAVVMPIRTV